MIRRRIEIIVNKNSQVEPGFYPKHKFQIKKLSKLMKI